MHFDYYSVTGEVFSFDVDVNSEISEAIVGREADEDNKKVKGMNEIEFNKNRAETRYHQSLYSDAGIEYAAPNDTATEPAS